MLNSLVIGGVAFPIPKKGELGSISVQYEDVVNEYGSETGETTVEIIRCDVATISVSYSAITETLKNTLLAVLSPVADVTFDKKGVETEASMRVSGVSTAIKLYGQGTPIWSLSFKLEEL
ncbi:MAG: hypothetical protein LUE96_07270 [Lachnospiraceae bacterium]|nr:hypothetical protein [Lachnospiraceae bacterium]